MHKLPKTIRQAKKKVLIALYIVIQKNRKFFKQTKCKKNKIKREHAIKGFESAYNVNLKHNLKNLNWQLKVTG